MYMLDKLHLSYLLLLFCRQKKRPKVRQQSSPSPTPITETREAKESVPGREQSEVKTGEELNEMIYVVCQNIWFDIYNVHLCSICIQCYLRTNGPAGLYAGLLSQELSGTNGHAGLYAGLLSQELSGTNGPTGLYAGLLSQELSGTNGPAGLHAGLLTQELSGTNGPAGLYSGVLSQV